MLKMADFNLDVLMEKYAEKTVLAISPKIINQVTAEKMAREQFFRVGAKPPPANVRYQVFGSIRNYNTTRYEHMWCMITQHPQQ